MNIHIRNISEVGHEVCRDVTSAFATVAEIQNKSVHHQRKPNY